MKRKTVIIGIIVACFSLALLAGGCRHRARGHNGDNAKSGQASGTETINASEPQADLSFTATDEDGVDLAEKEEIRRKYKTKDGAADQIRGVEIRGINGGVKIETGNTDTAEVLVVRSAKKREDLQQYHQVKVEVHDNTLLIRVENDRKSIFSAIGSRPEGHQRVVLKLPRKIDLELSGANGKIAIGEIMGQLRMNGINGEIKATRIAGETEIHGLNGGLDASFAPLSGNGIELGGINGNIDLHFEGEVNADLNAWGINGQINADLPNVQNKNNDEAGRGRMKARIGTGGTQIRVNGVNGNVNLSKTQRPAASAAKVASK
ncbi:MAG: DUF4097 domain-containing protein [Acidobacteriota bacterium]|nr:DUF4097 domain-containing protein [Acidobacteriota bacterium]